MSHLLWCGHRKLHSGMRASKIRCLGYCRSGSAKLLILPNSSPNLHQVLCTPPLPSKQWRGRCGKHTFHKGPIFRTLKKAILKIRNLKIYKKNNCPKNCVFKSSEVIYLPTYLPLSDLWLYFWISLISTFLFSIWCSSSGFRISPVLGLIISIISYIAFCKKCNQITLHIPE